MVSTLVPIFVCVILPIAIVLITALTKINSDNKQTQIIIKAIEANKEVDTDKLIESMRRPRKSAREILNLRLLRGCMFFLIGIGLEIIGLFNFATNHDSTSDPVVVPIVFGCIPLAIGISYLIVYRVTRKELDQAKDE